MPDIQEIVALGIVALVAGRLAWKRWARWKATGKAGACGDCSPATPSRGEATVHFYRRRNAEGPASGAPEDKT